MMALLTHYSKRFSSLQRFLPLAALLVVMLLAFGVFVPFLGFYWDDWLFLLTYRLFGVQNFWDFHSFDRPFSAWTNIVTLPILGTSPLPWQIFTLTLRLLTVLAFWRALRLLWPAQKNQAAWAALLFAVYPLFMQQAASVTYSQHWICYLLFMLSVIWMLQAYGAGRKAPALLLLSLGAASLHLLTMEYFAGVELLRPALLWIASSRLHQGRKMRLRSTVLWSLPYLALLVCFILWRFFFQTFPEGAPNSPFLLISFLQTPLSALQRFAVIALQDTIHLLARAWALALLLFDFDTQTPFQILSWGLAALAGGVSLFAAWQTHDTRSTTPNERATHRPQLQWMGLGLLAMWLGMLPAWSTDRQLIVGMYSDRFGLPAMFGASMVWVGFIHWLVPDWKKRALLLSALVALAVGMHARTMNEYRWSWTLQRRFYWQLSWRAPDIQPNTPVFSDGEIFSYVGLYSTSAGINLLYGMPSQSPPNAVDPQGVEEDLLDYWFFSLGREFAFQMPNFLAGMPVEGGLRMYAFRGHSRDGLMVHYDPSVSGCLAVLSPQDVNLPDLPEATRVALPNANLGRIIAQPVHPVAPSMDIFGPEPEHDWCYLYQKADFARQQGDWEQIAALGQVARQQGYSVGGSSSEREWLPFIEGYARSGDWETAVSITQQVISLDHRMNASLCDLWLRIHDENRSAVEQVLAQLPCSVTE